MGSGSAWAKKTASGGWSSEQHAHGCGGCSVPGNIRSQAGLGSQQPDLDVGVPVHCQGVELDGL